MAYLICPGCRLTVYSAAGHSTTGRCHECDSSLEGAGRSPERFRRWTLADLRSKPKKAERGTA